MEHQNIANWDEYDHGIMIDDLNFNFKVLCGYFLLRSTWREDWSISKS